MNSARDTPRFRIYAGSKNFANPLKNKIELTKKYRLLITYQISLCAHIFLATYYLIGLNIA